MTGDWREGNDRHLSAVVAWVRARLERLVPTENAEENEDRVDEAGVRVSATEALNPPPTLVGLARAFELTRFERDVLALCAAMELDTRVAALCARAHDHPDRPYPTFALAMAAFDDPEWDALAPGRPLRGLSLVEVDSRAGEPVAFSRLAVDERILGHLKCIDHPDARLGAVLAPLDAAAYAGMLAESQREVAATAAAQLAHAVLSERGPVVQLLGSDSVSKQLVAAAAAAGIGASLLRMPAELLPGDPADVDALALLWHREARLNPVVLLVDADALLRDPSPGQPLARFLQRAGRSVMVSAPEPRRELANRTISLDVRRPSRREQHAAWSTALGPEGGQAPTRLAGQFDLDLATIEQVARAETLVPWESERDLGRRLWRSCALRTRPAIDALAQRITPKATWDDLVLPEPQREALRQIASQAANRVTVYEGWGFGERMSRGLGITALFAGDSGTGKTMAAEVIANELELPLFRVDLAAVVDKYIGETEKHLRTLFDAAEQGGALVLVDEADSVLGKRTEVHDSRDHYANVGVNYMLQRMESYRGLAVLATNMKSALDSAFMRRLRFVVDFPFPGRAERREMWERVLPAGVPRADLDLDRLARLDLAGGGIHNVALNASFEAAAAGEPVTTPLLLKAARMEFEKIGRPVNAALFEYEAAA
jgi:ATPase family associated with various cellular activities (AAA)